ncbi:unnamed protein product [Oikopleura dioica]|uniref:ShKT domain-containing protein n=1 Tax=Oikopleura dioica TaxID=34765 RepID=E4YPS8_OIKDI|nr:unnamed protein product [Oikopleura dioica]
MKKRLLLLYFFGSVAPQTCSDKYDRASCYKLKNMGFCSQYGEDCKLTCGKCAERSSSFISNSVELGRNCTGAEIKSLNCEQRCRVTNDIAECACHGGFKADGRRCVDQNECADSSLRDSCEELNLKCYNYEGGYFCGDAQSCGFSEMRRFRQAGCCKTDSSEMCGKQSIVQRGRIYGGEDDETGFVEDLLFLASGFLQRRTVF